VRQGGGEYGEADLTAYAPTADRKLLGVQELEFLCDRTRGYERSPQLGDLWAGGSGSSATASDVGPEFQSGGDVFDLFDGANVQGSKAGDSHLRAGAGLFEAESRAALSDQCA